MCVWVWGRVGFVVLLLVSVRVLQGPHGPHKHGHLRDVPEKKKFTIT